MNKSKLCMLACAVGVSVWAAEVTLTKGNSGGQSSWNTALNWSNGAIPAAGNTYVVPSRITLRTPDGGTSGVFAGDGLVFQDKAGFALKGKNNDCATADFVVYGANIVHSVGGGTSGYNLGIGGTMEVKGVEAAPTTLLGSASGSSRILKVSAALSGDSTAVLRVSHSTGDTITQADINKKNIFECEFSGDNSAYNGRFIADRPGNVTACDYVMTFTSQKALGAPVSSGAKVTIADNFALAGNTLAFTNGYSLAIGSEVSLMPRATGSISGFAGGEAFYFGKGASIDGNGDSVIYLRHAGWGTAACFDDVSLSGIARISVQGDAVMRVYPGYDNPAVPVELLGTMAWGASNVGPVTLKSGGKVSPGYGTTAPQSIGTFGLASLEVEEGGSLEMTVALVDGKLTNDFIRVAGNIEKSCEKIRINFNGFVTPTPSPAPEIPLLSAANLGTDVAAEDFEVSFSDAFLKRTIEGRFEIRDVGGEKTLYFVQTNSVVTLTANDQAGEKHDSWHQSGFWSNNEPVSSAYDYVVPNGKLLRRSVPSESALFKGRSLSILNGGWLAIKGITAEVNDFRLYSGARVNVASEGGGNRLKGNLHIDGQVLFMIENNANSTRTLHLESAISGSGNIRFSYIQNQSGDRNVGSYFLVTGDNSGFAGSIELVDRAVCTDFKNELAMGGPADSFANDRLRFTSNACLRCSSSYVMSDPTRGIRIGGGASGKEGGVIEVVGDQTLTISNYISGTTMLRKSGAGTLALCCGTNGFSGILRNQSAGVIAIGAAGAVADAKLQSTDAGAVWRIDAPEGMTVNSIDNILTEGGTGFLSVRVPAIENPEMNGSVTANIVRFKGATAADAERALSLVRLDASSVPKGRQVEVVAEETEGALLVKVLAKPRGFAIYFR